MESGDDSDSDSEVGSDSETESTKEGPIASATEPAADTAPPVVPSEGTSGSQSPSMTLLLFLGPLLRSLLLPLPNCGC